ncbi:protein-disulfide reductase DsbD family protein [Sphingosinicella soli]|uniref:Thiol:disulfide interchange protein/DsbC/DsbD-like thiol-disulfide interchange protein n=1 Tax=Sphingosinicella soli TaxID=333708 RepID=A0A7W7B1F8_9SPHN|nr:protein-disulfide reductase DsbD domain-containing protein [Sphingosinicella soli]MBB4632251.1 thiol:disulfide interchange protein/DsbC/DsbD-like thiol-disulfide interchange protein [Sphingosinicella soli]
MFRAALLLLAVLASPAFAAAVQNPHTRVELIAESAAPAPGSAALAIVMTPRPGWHTYWKNPGSAGMETQAAWTLPPGASASAIRYPVPSTFTVSGIMNYVFEGESALLVDLTVPQLAPGTALPVKVRVDYLVCDDELCVPETADLAIDLTVGDGAADPAAAPRFDRARAALPRPVDWPARYARADGKFRLSVDTAGADDIADGYFFPDADGVLDYDAPQAVSRVGDTLIIETVAGAAADPGDVTGILRLDRTDGSHFGASLTARAGEVAAAGAPLAQTGHDPHQTGLPSVFTALALAVLGGFILNVMPCVFPILGLKALSLASGGHSERAARRDALAYTAGVVGTCVALGAAILALRALGSEIGWAFQLQDPRVIFLLLLLVTAIALNLAGLFEISAPRVGGDALAGRGGAQGAFWTGTLAAIVATPCTGPFMGLALGAAILLPPALGLLIFAGLGLGLALPFILIGFIPALRRRLPKPGPWMVTFRRVMALPMLATAVALAWVLGRQAGVAGMAFGLAAAVFLAAGLWWVGIRQQGGRSAAVPLVVAALSLVMIFQITPRAESSTASAALPNVEPFSEVRLAALRGEGPVFVYFTADWCITCKVNENGALSAAPVTAAFTDAGIRTLVGDWTNADPAITRFLESQGRAGVPLYLFYPQGREAEVLPQLLSESMMLELARRV